MLTENIQGGNAALSFPILKSDVVTLTVVTLVVGSSLTLSARIRLADGTIVPYAEEIPPQLGNTTLTINLNLPDGDLIGLSLRARSYTVAVGGIWASVDIYHNANITTSPVLNLIQGYVGGNQALTWPYTQPMSAQYNMPAVMRLNVTPAAGTNAVFTGGALTRCRILLIYMNFVTDATVINRIPLFRISTDYAGSVDMNTTIIQQASLTRNYTFAPTLPVAVTGSEYIYPFPPDMIIPYNGSFEIRITNIQPADQITDARMIVQAMTG